MTRKRTLIYVPMLHAPADMGSLANRLPQPSEYGLQVGHHWEQIAAELRGRHRTWRGVLLYQDGLPDVSADIIARVVAEVDSPNFRLLRWLVDRGAAAVGTEDPVLLLEEYELLAASVADEKARRVYAARAAGLLAERDRYIAAKIGSTLPAGGTGILFIGLQHDVVGALPEDIRVWILSCCRDILPVARRSIASDPGAAGRHLRAPTDALTARGCGGDR